MKHTKHGTIRMQQRGKRWLDLRVIEKYGQSQRGGGVRMLSHRNAKRAINRLRRWLKQRRSLPMNSFSRRVAQVRKIIKSLEKAANWMMITALESSGERLITVLL